MEGELKVSSKQKGHTCGVCGDSASCYRLYGATTVCYSCRIFFRRTVKTRHQLTCARGGQEICYFDKTTRNKCRNCRYKKCLLIGMNPLLVDSCKKVVEHEADIPNNQPQPSQRSSVIVTNKGIAKSQPVTTFTSLNESLDWCTKENLEKKYVEICDKILLDPQGEYINKLFEVDKGIMEQARASKMKIVVSNDYIPICKSITETIGIEFLRHMLPVFSDSIIQNIASSTSITLMGLCVGIEQCFSHGSMLDQLQISFPYSSEFLKFWKRVAPDIDELKALPLDAFAMWTSPWAPKIEQEDFVSETIHQLDLLLHGNQDVSRLLFLLALFSPVDVELSADERAWLKHFQSKISMMVYSQVLGQEDRENREALEIVGRVGRIIEDLYKCGQIIYQGTIQYNEEEKVEDIETIEIFKL